MESSSCLTFSKARSLSPKRDHCWKDWLPRKMVSQTAGNLARSSMHPKKRAVVDDFISLSFLNYGHVLRVLLVPSSEAPLCSLHVIRRYWKRTHDRKSMIKQAMLRISDHSPLRVPVPMIYRKAPAVAPSILVVSLGQVCWAISFEYLAQSLIWFLTEPRFFFEMKEPSCVGNSCWLRGSGNIGIYRFA